MSGTVFGFFAVCNSLLCPSTLTGLFVGVKVWALWLRRETSPMYSRGFLCSLFLSLSPQRFLSVRSQKMSLAYFCWWSTYFGLEALFYTGVEHDINCLYCKAWNTIRLPNFTTIILLMLVSVASLKSDL